MSIFLKIATQGKKTLNGDNELVAGWLQRDQPGSELSRWEKRNPIPFLPLAKPPLPYIHCRKCTGDLASENVKEQVSRKT